MMRYGRIADINYTNGVAKVALDEVDIITDWATLPKALRSNRIFKIGQQVAVLYDGEDYEILNEVPGGENNQSPSWASNHAEGYEFADGTKIVYDTLTKQLTVTPIESGKVVVAGDAIVSGNQTIMGDLVAGATGIEFTKNFISSINPTIPPTDLNLMSALVVTNLLNLKADKTAVSTSVAELVPQSRTISGLSLTSNISQSALQAALGLGSGAYGSTAYLPLAGGTLTGDLNGTDISLSGGLEARQGAVFAGQYATFPSAIGTYVANYVSPTYGARVLAYDGSAYQKLSIGALLGANFQMELAATGNVRFATNVSIGMEQGYSALDIAGESLLLGSSAGLYLRNSLGAYASIVGHNPKLTPSYNALDIRAMAGTGNGIYLDTLGNIGFGKIPANKFDFNGPISATTANFSNLTAGYIPYQTANGLANSRIFQNDITTGIEVNGALKTDRYIYITESTSAYDAMYYASRTDLSRRIGMGIASNGIRGIYDETKGWVLQIDTSDNIVFNGNTAKLSNLTTGYLPYQTANGLANSNVYTDGTKVGIKTPTPEYDLDINGTLGVRGNTNIFQNLYIPNTVYSNQVGVINKGGAPFIHDFNYGNNGTVTTIGGNTFVGRNAGNFTMGATATTTDGASCNSGFGEGTLRYNVNGKANTAVGYTSLYSNTNGQANTAVGVNALRNNTTGYYNIALGFQAGLIVSNGSANQTGNINIFIGANTKALADGDTNEIVIGYNATGVGSNSVMIGNSDVTSVYFGGSSHNSNIYAAGGNFSGNVTSSNYVSESIGWRITNAGAADFRSVYTDALHAKAFIADISQALAGEDFLTKSVSKLSENFTIPAVNGTATFIVDDLQGFPATRCFVDGDYIRFREIDRSSGALNFGNIWGTVVLDTTFGTNGFLNGRQRYTFTCISNDSFAGYQIGAGAEVLDYGISGNGLIKRTVLDSAGSPYMDITTWVTDPSNSANYTTHVRLGNLSGVTDCSGYGLYSDNVFLTKSIVIGDLTKSGNYLSFDTVNGLQIKLGNTSVATTADVSNSASSILSAANTAAQGYATTAQANAANDATTKANNAITSANGYTNTQISIVNGNITSAISSVQIGGTNLAIYSTATMQNMTYSNGVFSQSSADTASILYFYVFSGDNNTSTITHYINSVITSTGKQSFYFTTDSNIFNRFRIKFNGKAIDTVINFWNSNFKPNTQYVISINFLNNTQGSIQWSEIKIEEGNKATTWSPAPEDVTNAISTAQSNAIAQSETNAAALYVTQTNYNSYVSQTDQAIAARVTTTTFNALGDRVSTAESNISANANAITQKVSTTDYTGNTIASLINQSATTIAIQASKINLTGAVTFTSLDSSTQGVINAKADTNTVNTQVGNAITSANGYTNTQISIVNGNITSAISSVQIGGTNLAIYSTATMQNMTYSNGVFSQSSADTASILYFDVFSGDNNTSTITHYINSVITSTGKQSFYFTTDSNIFNRFRIRFNGKAIDTAISFWNSNFKPNTQYVISINFLNNTQGSIQWSEIKIEEGNKATAWSPAPEDINTSILTSQTSAQNNLANKLGYTDYATMVSSVASAGTIISGGYINTSLLAAQSILAEKILTTTITSLGAVTAGSFNLGSGKFQVDTSGYLTATGATITGAINATSGYIGDVSAGWLIGASYLYNDTYKTGLAPADYPFYAGQTYTNRATAPFRVTKDGAAYASNINITGTSKIGIFQIYDYNTGDGTSSGLDGITTSSSNKAILRVGYDGTTYKKYAIIGTDAIPSTSGNQATSYFESYINVQQQNYAVSAYAKNDSASSLYHAYAVHAEVGSAYSYAVYGKATDLTSYAGYFDGLLTGIYVINPSKRTNVSSSNQTLDASYTYFSFKNKTSGQTCYLPYASQYANGTIITLVNFSNGVEYIYPQSGNYINDYSNSYRIKMQNAKDSVILMSDGYNNWSMLSCGPSTAFPDA